MDEEFDIPKELSIITSELVDFIKYLRLLNDYIVKVLPRFYSIKVKELKGLLSGFENADTLKQLTKTSDIRDTNVFKYMTQYLEVVLPISEELSKTNIDLFDLKEHLNTLEKYEKIKNADISKKEQEKKEKTTFYLDGDRKAAVYLPNTQLDFCVLWEDTDIINNSMKKKFIVFLSVLFKKTVKAKDTADSIDDHLEKKEILACMNIGMSGIKDILDNTLSGEEHQEHKEKMNKFFNVVTDEFVDKKINPIGLLGDLMKGGSLSNIMKGDLGKLSLLASLASSVGEKIKDMDINEELVDTLTKMSEGITDTVVKSAKNKVDPNDQISKDLNKLAELKEKLAENHSKEDNDVIKTEIANIEERVNKRQEDINNINEVTNLMGNLLNNIKGNSDSNGQPEGTINIDSAIETINKLHF